ncbi:MAG: hypothetical protein IRY94_21050 [Rhodospirillaceae bacterium]|nr:hypothetical protein [Rhodospirillaceae bacterium]
MPTYPGAIVTCGYDTAENLSRLIARWRALLATVEPDFVIADYAPSALLAAATLGIPRAAAGTPHAAPPRSTPLPVLRGATASPDAQLRIEEQVLAAVRGALRHFGAPVPAVLADMFPAIEDILCIFPELDHYGARPERLYCGPLSMPFGREPPAWPAAEGPRLLVYMQGNFVGLPKLLADLGTLGMPTLVHMGGTVAPAALAAAEAAGPTLRLSGPIDMAAALEQADLLLCHGGPGVVSQALLGAVPPVTVPLHSEQAAVQAGLAALGAGLPGPNGWDEAAATAFDYGALAERALGDPQLAANAARFAARYRGFDAAAAAAAVIAAYEAALAERHR